MRESFAITPLLRWAAGFFLIAILAGVLGFGGIAGAATSIAQILFFGFLVVAVIMLLAGLFRR